VLVFASALATAADKPPKPAKVKPAPTAQSAIKQDIKNDKREIKSDQAELKRLKADLKAAEKAGDRDRVVRDAIRSRT
jgi:hypothetical protein